MSDVKLRPCPNPWCEANGAEHSREVQFGYLENPTKPEYYVVCQCGVHGPFEKSKAKAAAAWNTRSESPVEKAAGEMYTALEKMAQRANETGTGDLAWQSTVFDMHASARTALAAFDKAKEGK